MGCSERRREIKRRRQRREKLGHLRKRLENATKSEREEIVRKLRCLTSGADVVIPSWELTDVDR